jgi:hypothetical protein
MRSVQHHTPFIPSRLSEEFTANSSAGNNTTSGSNSPHKQLPYKHSVEDRVYASPSSPLDIPNISYSKPRTESMSVSNKRTSGYDDMHANVEIDLHPHSLSKDMKYAKPRSTSVRNRLSYYLQEDDSTDKISSKSQQAQSFEDDDLLFAMSDMHMTNSSARSEHTSSPWDPAYQA